MIAPLWQVDTDGYSLQDGRISTYLYNNSNYWKNLGQGQSLSLSQSPGVHQYFHHQEKMTTLKRLKMLPPEEKHGLKAQFSGVG